MTKRHLTLIKTPLRISESPQSEQRADLGGRARFPRPVSPIGVAGVARPGREGPAARGGRNFDDGPEAA